MNTKQIPKIKLMLTAIISRLNDNIDYFKSIVIEFKSGGKIFQMKIIYDGDKFKSFFEGENLVFDSEEIPDIILDKIDKFDEMTLKYYDRFSELVLSCDGKNTSLKQNNASNSEIISGKEEGREYIIKSNAASDLLKEIGIMAQNNKIKNDMIRKYKQIDRFVELISDINFGDKINVMDCGCGKSYLSFVLNYYYTEICKKKCNVFGIDYNPDVINASKATAENLKYDNMQFITADLRELDLKQKIDMVISLHACDIATDYAIYAGLKHNAKAIICIPCCHRELMEQINNTPIDSILKHGVYKNRFCDMLTDTMRSLLLESLGYKVSVIEYVSPLDTPKNTMLKAVKHGERNTNAKEEYARLKEMFNVSPTLEKLISTLNFM